MKVKRKGCVLVINDKLKDHYINDLGYEEVKEDKPEARSVNDVPSCYNDL